MNLNQKVHELWIERNMIEYCDALWSDAIVQLQAKDIIFVLQKKIFDFDHDLEENILSQHELDGKYERLKQTTLATLVRLFWDIDKAKVDSKKLRNFFEMEMWMRQQYSPLKFSIHDFYTLKQCDIFLHRRIIEHVVEKAPKDIDLITQFDALWEVWDDMEDVYEDINAINSNRFLISWVENWWDETVKEYRRYIEKQWRELLKHTIRLKQLWLDVAWLLDKLDVLMEKDYSEITESRTNEMLYG